MTTKTAGFVALALVLALGGGWIWGASGKATIERDKRRVEESLHFETARAQVLEGRLTAYIADKAGAAALKVFLDASEDVRAERITGREGGATAERLREIQAREDSDRHRYRVLYGVDYHDPGRYDLVMLTDRQTPEELARAIVRESRARFPG